MSLNLGQFIVRFKLLKPGGGVQPSTISEIENCLGMSPPADFKQVSTVFSGGKMGNSNHHEISATGISSIVGKPLECRAFATQTKTGQVQFLARAPDAFSWVRLDQRVKLRALVPRFEVGSGGKAGRVGDRPSFASSRATKQNAGGSGTNQGEASRLGRHLDLLCWRAGGVAGGGLGSAGAGGVFICLATFAAICATAPRTAGLAAARDAPPLQTAKTKSAQRAGADIPTHIRRKSQGTGAEAKQDGLTDKRPARAAGRGWAREAVRRGNRCPGTG